MSPEYRYVAATNHELSSLFTTNTHFTTNTLFTIIPSLLPLRRSHQPRTLHVPYVNSQYVPNVSEYVPNMAWKHLCVAATNWDYSMAMAEEGRTIDGGQAEFLKSPLYRASV